MRRPVRVEDLVGDLKIGVVEDVEELSAELKIAVPPSGVFSAMMYPTG